MYIISKDFAFSAAHHLNGLPPEHKCARLHGHNYIVRVEIGSDDLDETGFVIDYGELSPFSKFIDAHLDHRDLNEVLPALGGPSQPSAELMAEWFKGLIRDLIVSARGSLSINMTVAVGVSETPKCWAWSR